MTAADQRRAHPTAGRHASPRTRPVRRLDVQGLRAVAVLLVVAYHAGLPMPGGFVGVDVFFVISGFVIISLIHTEIVATSRLDFAGFYARRVRRILPALALVTVLTVVAAWAWLSPLGTQQITAQTAIGASLFVANWTIRASSGNYFDEAAETNPLLHTWSLSVEEQFYLVFPALLLAVWWLARRRRWPERAAVTGLLLVLTAVTFLLAWFVTGVLAASSDSAAGYAFYGSVFRVWEFAVGGLVAVAVVSPWRPLVARLVGALGVVAIAASAVVITGQTPFPGPWTLLPVLGTAAVIAAGAGREQGVVPGLAGRPMVWLGDLSYSWYLWHWPLIVFASVLWPGSATAALVAGFGSLLPAWLSFRLVEQPLRSSGARGRKAVLIAVVCIGVPVAAASVLHLSADRAVADVAADAGGQAAVEGLSVSADPFRAAVLAQQGQWKVLDEPCLGGGSDADVGTCLFGDPSLPRLLLVGDSHAGAYAPGVLEAAAALGYSVEVITSSGCPFMDLPMVRGGEVDEQCRDRVDEVWSHIEKDPPSVVLIAHRSPRFVSPEQRLVDERIGPGRIPCVADEQTQQCLPHDDAVRAWQAELRRAAARLGELGSDVAVLQTVPEHEGSLERCTVGRSVDLSCLQTPRELTESRRADVIAAEQAVARRLGLVAFDPFERYCDDTTCDQVQDDRFHYRNDDHLNVTGSRALVQPLTRVISQATGGAAR